MSSNEKLKCHKVPYVLKGHVPNKYTYPLGIFHLEMKMCQKSYCKKLYLSHVLETINLNLIKTESYTTLVEDALERLATNQKANIDPLGQQENEVTERLNEEVQNMKNDESFIDEEFTYDIGSVNNSSPLPVFQNSIIRGNSRSLNEKERQVFERIHKWSRNYFKNLPNKQSPILQKPFICQLAKINETTTHSALGINVGSKMYSLNDRQREILRNKPFEVKFFCN